MMKIQRLGFTLLEDKRLEKDRSKAEFIIIFVHGLRGHPKDTWEWEDSYHEDIESREPKRSVINRWVGCKSSLSSIVLQDTTEQKSCVYWPLDLLSKAIPNAKIFTYGYNADVIQGIFQAANENSIARHAQDLIDYFERTIQEELPIIFVAHSLGGIIVKDAICRAKIRSAEKHTRLAKLTKCIIFLGTPHRRSIQTGWDFVARTLSGLAFQDMNSPSDRDLVANSWLFDKIQADFLKFVENENLKVHSFQEGRDVSNVEGFSGKIVDSFASKIDHPLETVEIIDADHRRMAKFTGTDDPGYRKVSNAIVRYMKEILQGPPISMSIFSKYMKLKFSIDKVFVMGFQPRPSRRYIGRRKEFDELERAIAGNNQIVVLYGRGGSGKTELAAQYCNTHRKRFNSVLWFDVSDKVAVTNSYQKACTALRIRAKMTIDEIIDNVKVWLVNYTNWLLVLDGADNLVSDTPDGIDINQLLPPAGHGSIIITTRIAGLPNIGKGIQIEDMDPEDAKAFFLDITENRLKEPGDETNSAAVVKLLGYLALGIEVAGVYVSQSACSITSFLGMIEKHQADAFIGDPTFSLYPKTILTTWELLFERVRSLLPSSVIILQLCSFTSPRSINEEDLKRAGAPIEQFEGLGDRDCLTPQMSGLPAVVIDALSEERVMDEAIRMLISHSLMKREDESTLTMHPLIRRWVVMRPSKDEQLQWVSTAVSFLFHISPKFELIFAPDNRDSLTVQRPTEVLSSGQFEDNFRISQEWGDELNTETSLRICHMLLRATLTTSFPYIPGAAAKYRAETLRRVWMLKIDVSDKASCLMCKILIPLIVHLSDFQSMDDVRDSIAPFLFGPFLQSYSQDLLVGRKNLYVDLYFYKAHLTYIAAEIETGDLKKAKYGLMRLAALDDQWDVEDRSPAARSLQYAYGIIGKGKLEIEILKKSGQIDDALKCASGYILPAIAFSKSALFEVACLKAELLIERGEFKETVDLLSRFVNLDELMKNGAAVRNSRLIPIIVKAWIALGSFDSVEELLINAGFATSPLIRLFLSTNGQFSGRDLLQAEPISFLKLVNLLANFYLYEVGDDFSAKRAKIAQEMFFYAGRMIRFDVIPDGSFKANKVLLLVAFTKACQKIGALERAQELEEMGIASCIESIK